MFPLIKPSPGRATKVEQEAITETSTGATWTRFMDPAVLPIRIPRSSFHKQQDAAMIVDFKFAGASRCHDLPLVLHEGLPYGSGNQSVSPTIHRS